EVPTRLTCDTSSSVNASGAGDPTPSWICGPKVVVIGGVLSVELTRVLKRNRWQWRAYGPQAPGPGRANQPPMQTAVVPPRRCRSCDDTGHSDGLRADSAHRSDGSPLDGLREARRGDLAVTTRSISDSRLTR